MPNRILREGILTSPRIAKLGWAEEVFYRRLHSVVDDFGRYFADAGLLRAACYPRQLNKVSDPDIGKWLAACESAALVRVYPAQDGERYLELLDFKQQVRAKESKFPNPLSTCVADAKQTPADAHLVVSVSVSEDVVGTVADAPASRARRTKLPEDFAPNETGTRLCAEGGFVMADELAKFRNHHDAKGSVMADWQAGWRTWIDKAKQFRKPGFVAQAGRPNSDAEETARMLAEKSRNTRGPSVADLERMAQLRKAA